MMDKADFREILVILVKRWILIFLAIELVFFAIFGTNYLSLRNLQNILLTSTVVLLLATGQTFVIISTSRQRIGREACTFLRH